MKEEAGALRRRKSREGWKTRKLMEEMVMSWDEEEEEEEELKESVTVCCMSTSNPCEGHSRLLQQLSIKTLYILLSLTHTHTHLPVRVQVHTQMQRNVCRHEAGTRLKLLTF